MAHPRRRLWLIPFLCKGNQFTTINSPSHCKTFCIVHHRFLSRCRRVSKCLPGHWWDPGDPLEQHHQPGLVPSGGWQRWGDVLGVLLLGAGLQRRVEPRRPLCPSQLLTERGLPHHVSAPASRGIPRPSSAALQGMV